MNAPLRLDPDKAVAVAGFDFFTVGVPDRESLEQLAEHLDALGEQHAGVHFATIDWILPMLHDPDGHEVRFYTLQSHTTPDADQVTTVNDLKDNAQRREPELAGARTNRSTVKTRAHELLADHRADYSSGSHWSCGDLGTDRDRIPSGVTDGPREDRAHDGCGCGEGCLSASDDDRAVQVHQPNRTRVSSRI